MAKSSIHFNPVKGNSESHNLRQTPLDYTLGADLTATNESWVDDKIRSRQSDIEAHCRNVSGRKMNKNATPIREGVVNLNANHSLADCRRLGDALRDKFQIDCFQIHIHRDEGKSREERNYHAHMVFDWQDKSTGKMLRLNKLAMSQIQTLVADSLEMERGKEGSQAVRLEAQAYKATKECEAQEAKAEALRQECAKLEQGNEQKREEREKIGAEVAVLERKKQVLLEWFQKRLRILKEKLQSLNAALNPDNEQKAINLLIKHCPANRKDALQILGTSSMSGSGKFLSDVIEGFTKATGVDLSGRTLQPVSQKDKIDVQQEKHQKAGKSFDFGIGD